MNTEIKVYCVVTTKPSMGTDPALKRVSQWYSRASDAKRKSKSLNERIPWTKAVAYSLTEMEDIT
jgi:hypothetical protein